MSHLKLLPHQSVRTTGSKIYDWWGLNPCYKHWPGSTQKCRMIVWLMSVNWCKHSRFGLIFRLPQDRVLLPGLGLNLMWMSWLWSSGLMSCLHHEVQSEAYARGGGTRVLSPMATWYSIINNIIVSGKAIVSAENNDKIIITFGQSGLCPELHWGLKVLPQTRSWWGGGCCPLPRPHLPLSAFGLAPMKNPGHAPEFNVFILALVLRFDAGTITVAQVNTLRVIL